MGKISREVLGAMKKVIIFEASTDKTQNMENKQIIYCSFNQLITKRAGYDISGICVPWVVDIR